MPRRPISAADARRIAHDVVGEHIEHPAPKGHKGLEKVVASRGTMESLIKRAKAKLASRGK